MPSPSLWALAWPAGLLLLASVPFVVWLHFRRRPGPRMVVPSLAPWRAMAAEAARRRRRVPPGLLLIMHAAVAGIIAVAAAGPHAATSGGRVEDLVIVLDTTYSMAAGDRWRQALDTVRGLSSEASGRVSLVTLGPDPRAAVVRSPDRLDLDAAIDELRPAGSGADWERAIDLARSIGGATAEKAVVTDGALELPSAVEPQARWLRVGQVTANLAIVEARARTVSGDTTLYARAASYGDTATSAVLRLLVDGRERDRRSVTLGARSVYEAVWDVSPADRWAEVRIDVSDALPDDNWATVPLQPEPLVVQAIGGSEPLLRAVRAMPQVELRDVGAATYRTDGTADVTLATRLQLEVLPPGGLVLVQPPDSERVRGGVESMEARIDAVGDHPISEGLDLWGAEITDLAAPELPPWAEPVMEAGGRVAAYAGVLDGTRVVVLAFDPASPGLAERTAFPLLIARAIEWAAGDRWPAVLQAGTPVWLPDATVRVYGPAGRQLTADGGALDTRSPGRYEVHLGAGSEARVRRLGVRVGDETESDLDYRLPFAAAASPPSRRRAPALVQILAAVVLSVLAVEGAWRSGLLARRGGVV